MKRLIILLITLAALSGCSSRPDTNKQVLAKINDYEITTREFREECINAPYFNTQVPEGRREVLNNLINRKLILQDAERRGLHKDRNFIRMVEKFWEQSLLKLSLDIKARQIAGSLSASDEEIKSAYQKMFAEGKTDKTYDQMYRQLKRQISRDKETRALGDWMEMLRRRAKIKVNEELLNAK